MNGRRTPEVLDYLATELAAGWDVKAFYRVGRARDLSKHDEDAKRLAYGFRLCMSRPPGAEEVGISGVSPRPRFGGEVGGEASE